MGQRVSTERTKQVGTQAQHFRPQLFRPQRRTVPRDECVTLIVDRNQKYIFIDIVNSEGPLCSFASLAKMINSDNSDMELPLHIRYILNGVWRDVFQAQHVDRYVVYLDTLYQFTATPIIAANRVIGGIMFIRHSPCDVINPSELISPNEDKPSYNQDGKRSSLDIETERRILSRHAAVFLGPAHDTNAREQQSSGGVVTRCEGAAAVSPIPD
jgi:hypothetical protein